MRKSPRLSWKIIFIALWLGLTLSMAAWWMYFGLKLLNHDGRFTPSEIERQQNMLIWEGSAWMVLLLIGGLTLGYLVVREHKQSKKMREFMAAFSHDLKTALASLRLQVEALSEDLQGSPHTVLTDRLSADALRLQLQLENSLYLASDRNFKPFVENVPLSRIAERLKHQWPKVDIRLSKPCVLRADERALHSVFSNIVQNSVVHGQAQVVEIQVKREGARQVRLAVSDNGRGFSGLDHRLGDLFYRHNPKSGSGVGLYVVRQLVNKMGGEVEFKVRDKFVIDLVMEGSLL